MGEEAKSPRTKLNLLIRKATQDSFSQLCEQAFVRRDAYLTAKLFDFVRYHGSTKRVGCPEGLKMNKAARKLLGDRLGQFRISIDTQTLKQLNGLCGKAHLDRDQYVEAVMVVLIDRLKAAVPHMKGEAKGRSEEAAFERAFDEVFIDVEQARQRVDKVEAALRMPVALQEA